MDEQRRQIFMEELEDAVRQREELDAYIAALSKRLGVDVPNGSTSASEKLLFAAAGNWGS